MEEQKRSAGRPKGSARFTGSVKAIRFSVQDDARLKALAEKLETSEVEVLRQALRRMAEAEGVVVG
jgi:hypothetical protein